MQDEEHYDDLTGLFEAQDQDLQSEAFVARVMVPVRKRARWRTPLLFGAGGLGLGAALSQIGGLFDLVEVNTPSVSVSLSLSQVQAENWSLSETDPLWLAAALIVIVSCAAIFASERT